MFHNFKSAVYSAFGLNFLLGALAEVTGSPIVYQAVTDRQTRAKPPLPTLGPAGPVIKDPIFGTRILRVTAPGLLPQAPPAAFFSAADSFMHAWAADNSRVFVRSNAGLLVIKTLDVDELIRRNAEPIWLHQNDMWELMGNDEG